MATIGPSPQRPLLRLGVVAVLAAILALLAVQQYRWSLEVSRAERARIEASLNTSVSQFRQEFYRELLQVCSAFHREPGAEADDFWTGFAEGYQTWARTASRPDLVANVFVWEAGPGASSRLLQLRPALNQFEPVEWPARLEDLHARLAGQLHDRPQPPGAEARLFAWTLEEQFPALVRAVSNMTRPRWRRDGGGPLEPPHPLGFVIVELNGTVLEKNLLGELAQRFFAGPDGFIYNVAVVGGGPDGKIIYRSDPQLTRESLTPSDARTRLLASTPADFRVMAGGPPESLRQSRRGPGMAGPVRGGPVFRTRSALILPSPAGEPWQLLVRHRWGSLETVVAADRRRNLLLSFGVLLVLAVSMAMIIISTQRARRLAHLQMEFVAGVSHELRTPVAVICSAADNLAEGFVGGKDQVKEYGAVIRNEGRRLAGMIEQILHFAAGQAGRATYDLQPVQVSEAIADALANVSALPAAEGFTIERDIDPDLPPVRADFAALTRCLQNLVLNAVKYGGESRWVRVRAEKSAANGEPGIRISVEDRGMGIDPADRPHIFEPFYRGKTAQAAQIHGAGLGLSLSLDIAQAMGGRLTVASEPGRGSTFVLDLPAPSETAEPLPRTA
jgi:signal transduction histidine kinase/Tfp pilus assembly protein PilE